MSCFDAQVIERATMIRLDGCGRIPLTGDDPTPALKGLAGAVLTLARTRNVDIPTTTITKTINGRTCTKPRPAPTDRGYTYTLTFCGGNPMAEVVAGYKTIDLSGGDIIGWEDVNISGSPKVALEVVFIPSTDACAAGGAPLCQAVLVPMLEQWVRSGDESYNGEVIPDLVLAGQTALSANLFANYTNVTLPGYLAHWAPKFADIGTGRSWAYTRMITCPTADPSEDPCALTSLAAPAS